MLRHPSDVGLVYEDVTFPALDGVPLEGWFIPAEGTDRLVIANHPMGFSRSGQPTDRSPWRDEWGPSGNGVEVDFLPDYRILHDAGYHVLAYDLRNHGLSGAAHGGIVTSGWLESRDVVGSIRHARQRADLAGVRIALFSRCLGCNSTMAAMQRYPEEFDGISCLVGAQPVTTRIIVGHQLQLAGVPADRVEQALTDLDGLVRLRTSFGWSDRDNHEWAKSVSVPTLLYQVHDDVLTEPTDVQTQFDNIPVADKSLHWITGTTARWDGYLEFQRRPEPMLAWIDAH